MERERDGWIEKRAADTADAPKGTSRVPETTTRHQMLSASAPNPAPAPQVLKAVAQEGARLEQRQGRHKRQQKRAYARMVQGGHEEGADASPVGGALRRCWRAAAGLAARGDHRGAMALVGAAAVAAFAAALLLAPRLVAALVAAPSDGAE